MATQLEFDNLREFILAAERHVSSLNNHDEGVLLYECIDNVVPFLIGMGQAVSASTYAAFGKISIDLAYTTMDRWVTTYKDALRQIADAVEELNDE